MKYFVSTDQGTLIPLGECSSLSEAIDKSANVTDVICIHSEHSLRAMLTNHLKVLKATTIQLPLSRTIH